MLKNIKITENYDHKIIEPFVQKIWKENNVFKVKENFNKKKYYCLAMIPYPSGDLHMGHVRNYTIGDVISRYQRMLGKNVLYPIGWDAFGLPAENAAIQKGISPAKWTYDNISYMRKQMQSLGFSYDWSKEIITCSPKYYRWEQYFFIHLYNNNLAYKKMSLVNWCPKDKTVLANEQVIDNRCWRCNSEVLKKNISQWFLKITKYAEELVQGLELLSHWPKKVKNMQKKWIGKSTGIEVIVDIFNKKENISVYVDQPGILTNAVFLALSINHEFVLKESKNNSYIHNFIEKYKNVINNKLDNKDTGINTGIYAIHPLNKSLLPILVVNFLPNDYDQKSEFIIPDKNPRYFNFVKKNNLIFKKIINKHEFFNSLEFNILDLQEKNKLVTQKLIDLGIGKVKTCYRLRDWVISRQRYWGVPIPMVNVNGVNLPVKENKLPVILPENIDIKNFSDPFQSYIDYIKSNSKNSELYDTNTFDTFMESSWYHVRHTSVNCDSNIIDQKKADYWLPVDQYIGGIEHAVMHLMYFRFYHKLLRDAGFVKSPEPVLRLLCQGMVLSNAFYYVSENNKKIWVSPSDVLIKRDQNGNIIKAIEKNTKNKLVYHGMIKMSKSKNNGINPEKIINEYGADALRLFIMFAAPVCQDLEWQESGIKGTRRFLNRLWKITYNHVNSLEQDIYSLDISNMNSKQKFIYKEMNKTIIQVTNDIEKRQTFNNSISYIMSLTNKVLHFNSTSHSDKIVIHEVLSNIIKMLYPFTPHICFILWRYLNKKKDIDHISWPILNSSYIEEENNTIILVQVNSKFRGTVFTRYDSHKFTILKKICKINTIYKHIRNKKIKKIIFITNKVINILTYN